MSKKTRSLLTVTFSLLLGFLSGNIIWKIVQSNLDKDFIACRQHLSLQSQDEEKTKKAATSLPVDREKFLFVGIMTARKYLDSRARASHMTWAQRVPGRVVYFLGEGEEYTGDMPVIVLKGVTENDYPPQKKSFAMVKYMSDHFSNDYQWLIRADDDVYMKVDELVKFLKSINSTGKHYIGQPGFGKAIEEGKLGLSGAFCMGGPGVIMTPELIQAVAPALDGCLGHTATGHEDTELGRCITLSTGSTCTVSYEMKELFYQNYEELHLPQSSFKKDLGQDEIKALTLHPLKSGPWVFRMDNFFNFRELSRLERKVASLRQQINAITNALQDRRKDFSIQDITSIPDSPVTLKENEVLPEGQYVNLDKILMLPQGKSEYLPGPSWELLRYKRIFSSTLEAAKIQYNFDFKRRMNLHDDFIQVMRKQVVDPRVNVYAQLANHTFHRLHSGRGAEAIYYVKRTVKGEKYLQPHYVRFPFIKTPYIQEEEEEEVLGPNTKNQEAPKKSRGKPIKMLMPLFQRSAIYRRFLNMFQKVVKGYDAEVQLRVVVFTDTLGEHKLISSMTSAMLQKDPSLDIRLTFLEEPFNRGKGLMTALADLPYNSLLLFMDVDMEFTTEFLYRVSQNTVSGISSFFPIYFVHYNPESICYGHAKCDELLDSRRDEVGLWRSFSYGIGAVTKEDLVRAGGFKTDIVGWGLEDVDFFEKCQKIDLPVMRGSDPGMIHRYHPRDCNSSLPEKQYQQCLDSGAAMLGSLKTLYTILDVISHGQGI